MQLSGTFNWPPGQDSASFELGIPDVRDEAREFRVGVIPGEAPNMIGWSDRGWVRFVADVPRISFDVRKVDTVVIETRRVGGEDIETQTKWVIENEWPADAIGGTTVHTAWTF